MNASTRLLVNVHSVFVTDFENGRILIFDLEYNLKQVLETKIDKPTDVYVQDNIMYITNYRKSELVKYLLKDIIDENN